MASIATNFLCRSFGTSARICAKPGYFLYKLMDREQSHLKRVKSWEDRGPQIAKSLPTDTTRRQSVLNALYMDTITDILSSEFSTELEKFRIQIHNVRIMKSLDTINVYWSCGEDGLINLEAAAELKNLEPKIRKELLTVRHMGIIPRVNFVFFANAMSGTAVTAILNRLRAAGELDDVEPAPPPLREIPPVYGLDRDKILRILATRSLPADFLQPGDGTVGGIPNQTSASEDFMQQFRRSKLAEKRMKKNSLKQESILQKRAEILLIREQQATSQNDDDDQYDDHDQYDDEDEEIYVDDSDALKFSEEDEKYYFDHEDDDSRGSWEEEKQDP